MTVLCDNGDYYPKFGFASFMLVLGKSIVVTNIYNYLFQICARGSISIPELCEELVIILRYILITL